MTWKIGDWGLGIGDWGLGQSPIPNPQPPIPNPHLLKVTYNNYNVIFNVKIVEIEIKIELSSLEKITNEKNSFKGYYYC